MIMQAIAVSLLTAAVGVNTHDDLARSAYGNYPQVANALSYLGTGLVRDNIDSTNDSAEFALLNAQLGVRFDFFIALGAAGLPWQIKQIESNPAIVASVEGLNESDAWWQSYDGLTGIAATRAEQQALYAAIRADRTFDGVPVLQASFASLKTFPNYGDMAAYADAGNAHVYFGTGNNPGSWPAYVESVAGAVSPDRPVVTSETGWQTTVGPVSGVDPVVQAKYLLTLLLEQTAAGVPATFIYELVDNFYDPGNTNTEDHFGLFNFDWSPKPAAFAVHNLLTILKDSGTTSAPPATLDVTLSGMPATGGSELFSRSDGTLFLALWNDVRLSGPTKQVVIDQKLVNVTVNFGRSFAEERVYDPLLGTAPVAVSSSPSSVAITLSDHPVLVELSTIALGMPLVDAPSFAAPSSIHASPDVAVTVPGVVLQNAPSGSVTVTITAKSGTLSALDGLSHAVPTSGTRNLTLSGTTSVVAAELATLSYLPPSGAGRPDTLTVAAATGGGGIASVTIPVTIGATARATVSAGTTISVPTGFALTAGSTIAIPRVTVANLYAGATNTTLTVTLRAGEGGLQITANGATRTATTGAALTLSGTEAEMVDALRTLAYRAGGSPGRDSVGVTVVDAAGVTSTQSFGIAIL